MPNILLKLPAQAFPATSQAALVQAINQAAAEAEQIAPNPRAQSLCWIMIEEVADDNWTCGGQPVHERHIPCFALVCLPAGVLDDVARQRYVALMHAALVAAKPAHDPRPVLSSVILQEVPDGQWGGNGAIWMLGDIARVAGYAHLQHLVQAT